MPMGDKQKFLKIFSSRRLQISDKNALLDFDYFTQSFFRNQQWRSFYSCSTNQLCKFRNFGVSPCSNFLSRSLHFSTSSSNSGSSKAGFLRWYLGKLKSHPLYTKSITASLIYSAADLTSQMMTLPSLTSFEPMRTLRMAVYGMLILGPTQHFWFNFMSKLFPKTDVLTTFKKILMGQVVYGPCSASVFFSYNAALQGENRGEIVARLKRDLLPTLRNGLFFWPVCDFFTYKFTPVHLQPLVNSSCQYIWTIYLTYMANQKKAS